MIKARRSPPMDVPAVTHNSITYFKTGMTDITAEQGGRILWRVPIYTVTYDANLERDVQGIHINSLEFDSTKENLLIENERGKKFSLNIATRTVTNLN